MSLSVVPIKSQKKSGRFDLFQVILESLGSQKLQNGDILVISSKFVSNSQGRLLDIDNVKVSGTLNHICPFNRTYAISVCPNPHANDPSAPVVLV